MRIKLPVLEREEELFEWEKNPRVWIYGMDGLHSILLSYNLSGY